MEWDPKGRVWMAKLPFRPGRGYWKGKMFEGITPVAKTCPLWQLAQFVVMPVWFMVQVANAPTAKLVVLWHDAQSSAVAIWVPGFDTGVTPWKAWPRR